MYLPNEAVAAEQKQAWQVISGLRRAPKRAIPRTWWVGLGTLVLSVLVLYVHTVGAEAQLVALQKEIQELKKQNVLESASLATHQNPQNVEAIATQKLGMTQPKDVVYMQPTALSARPKVNAIPPAPAVIHEGF